MSGRLTRFGVGALLLFSIAAPALAQSTREEWLALRTRKQARHHRLPGPATQPDAFTITSIRFFSDAAGQLVGVGEARNDTVFDLSYSRLNFTFLDADGAELGREWTYLHGGVNARITANNAFETLLVPGATGFFKIWTTIPAASMASYTVVSAGENLPFAKPAASMGLPGFRPERWAPLVHVPGASLRVNGPRLSARVLNDDPISPNCPCGHPAVFTSSVQVSVAAYHGGVIADVQSVLAVGPTPTARCSDPQMTGMTLHQSAAFTINWSQPADLIRWHSVEWDENEPAAAASEPAFIFDEGGGQESFTVNHWCSGTAVASAPWITVTSATRTGDSGRVSFRVAPNAAASRRTAGISLSGLSISVLQGGTCPLMTPSTMFLPATRVTLLVAEFTLDCLIGSSFSSDASWLRVAQSSGRLEAWVDANTTAGSRTAIVTLGSRSVTVHQSPASRNVDFNNDGRLDLLWHHRTGGRIAVWQMNGVQMGSGSLLSWSQVADTNWTPLAVGDLDQNGANDVIWQNHATGALALWRLSGTTVVKDDMLVGRSDSPLWKLRASSDFNRDGQPDFVWQHEGTGQIEIWLMRSGAVPNPPVPPSSPWTTPERLSTVPLGPGVVADLNWKIVGSGDFNGDGAPDIVWQHQTGGQIAVWKMNGATLMEGALVSPGQVSDLDWKIRAVGDINGDNTPDFIWQHRTDGRVAAWLMHGTTLISGVVIAQVADTNWEIVGPR